MEENKRRQDANWMSNLLDWGVVLLVIGFWVGIFYLLYQYAGGAFQHLLTGVRSRTANIVGIFLVVVVGFGLYVFREVSRSQYGLLEIAFGIVSGWFGISKFETSENYAEGIAIVAAVYLVVRGLDNYAQGEGRFSEDLSNFTNRYRGFLKYREDLRTDERNRV